MGIGGLRGTWSSSSREIGETSIRQPAATVYPPTVTPIAVSRPIFCQSHQPMSAITRFDAPLTAFTVRDAVLPRPSRACPIFNAPVDRKQQEEQRDDAVATSDGLR